MLEPLLFAELPPQAPPGRLVTDRHVLLTCSGCQGKGRLAWAEGDMPCPFCDGAGEILRRLPDE